MKKIIMLIIVIGFITACISLLTTHPAFTTEHKQYPMTAVVVDTDYAADVVVIEDCNGYLWEFYGVEDWEIGDVCTCIMDDNGTEKIFDDVIINAQYSGYFEMWGE